MRTSRVVAAAIALTIASVLPAAAQEPGNVGLTMTSASTVGVTIQAVDHVAIRPELGFSRTKSKAEGFSGTSTSWSPGLSLLFRVKSWDDTRLYLAPRWVYSRSNSTGSSSSTTTKSSGHALSAMVGAQHNITKRFAVFGETGVGRSSSKTEGTFSTNSSHTWSTRSIVGAILFF